MLGSRIKEAFPRRLYRQRRLCLISEREGPNPASGSYRNIYRQPVLLAGDSQR